MADPQQDPFASIAQPVAQAQPTGQAQAPPQESTADPFASIAQPMAPNGMPANSMQATDAENTPEGEAQAIAQREAQHPILSGMGQGAEALLQPVFHPIDTVVNLFKQNPATQLYEKVKQAVPVLNAYENARSQGKGVMDALAAADDMAGKVDDASQAAQEAVAAFKKNPSQETAKVLTEAAGTVGLLWAGGSGAAAEDAAPEVADAAAPEAETAETSTADNPGLIQKIRQGENVAQPVTQNAVRQGVQASAEDAGTADESLSGNIQNQPILSGNQTVLDQQLDALLQKSKDLYKQVDDTAGFDLKAEKAQLANDQYKLSQLGNTDADITQRGNLIEAINDSTDRIAEAQQKLTDAGIDPKAADAAHQQFKAGQDFKKVLVRSSNPDGTVDVDRLINQSKALRFAKQGDRLAQFMGKQGADDFMGQLQKAQKLGASAMKTQNLVKSVLKYAGWTGGLALGGDIVRHAIE